MWKTLIKWAAGKAFQWGLKKLTEEYAPAEKKPVKRRKPVTH
jgi:hypothetical protein